MARVPDASDEGAVAEKIRQRRAGGVLRPIDRVLLHAPRVADGWNALLGAIRGSASLPGGLRELIILRVAVLNRAPYEWDSHLGEARREGLSEAQIDAVQGVWPAGSDLFDADQQLALEVTDELTQGVKLTAPLFVRLSERFGTERIVELVSTVCAYNMVSRLVVAFDVESLEGERTGVLR